MNFNGRLLVVVLLIVMLTFTVAYSSEIVNHQLDSVVLAGNLIEENPTRSFSVYLPDGYNDGNDRYPAILTEKEIIT